MKPKRIQRKRTKGWKMPKKTIYVGRPTPWGNPFEIGCNPSKFSTALPEHAETIEDVMECYRYYVKTWMAIVPTWGKKLKGKDLACWCPLDKPCHADILLELIN